MATPEYRAAQSRPWQERPAHMLGDQDVLTALLSAEEYADIPFLLLERGRDIAQCFGPGGFTPRERLTATFTTMPCMIHAMGRKPWHFMRTPPILRDPRDWYDALGLELSPYIAEASRYLDDIDEPLDWFRRRTLIGRTMDVLALQHPACRGLLLSILDTALRTAKAAMKFDRIAVD